MTASLPSHSSATRSKPWLALLGLALCASLPAMSWGQSYPAKPVRLVVPYPPGGPTDIVARTVAQQLQESTGQPFIIDNRPGAGANLGAEAVAHAPADGYTLLVATTAHAINPSLFTKLNYSLEKDFVPISQLTSGPLVIVAHPRLEANNVEQLMALAQKKQGALNYGSSGNGQSTHLAAELFNAMAGVKIGHVPYKGSAQALTDVMAGQTDVMFDTMLSSMPHVKAGKLKALAVTSPQRSAVAPHLPTVAESGLPGYEAIAWNGLLAPAGTPQQAVQRLSTELRKLLDKPEVRQRFEAQGFASAWSAPESFQGFLHNEVGKWAQVVKTSGAKVD